MSARPLTPEQEAEAQVLYQRLKSAFEHEALQLARLMASKEDGELLGGTEFAVREQVHRLGAQVLETVLQARKKRVPGGAARLSRVSGGCPLRGLSPQGAGELTGAGVAGAAVLPLRCVWPRLLSVGWSVGGEQCGLESGSRRSGLCGRGPNELRGGE